MTEETASEAEERADSTAEEAEVARVVSSAAVPVVWVAVARAEVKIPTAPVEAAALETLGWAEARASVDEVSKRYHRRRQ